MSHTWHEVLYAAGRRNRIPTRPVCVRMTSAELHLCEDLTSSAQLGDGQREEEMEKQLLFFFFLLSLYLDAFCHVSEKQEPENENGSSPAMRHPSS